MKNILFYAAAPIVVSFGFARASPLVNLQILGSSDGVHYSSELVAEDLRTYDFEVVGQLAPVGSSNTQNGTTRTITSEVTGIDGIGSLSFNLASPDANPNQFVFTSESLHGTFAEGTGPSPGTQTSANGGVNNELLGVRPINPNGTFNALNGSPLVIETGTFTLPAVVGPSFHLAGNFVGTVVSSIKVNGGSSVVMSASTENGPDPIQSISPLLISTGQFVPEPASFALFGMGAAALLARRRRA